MIKKASILIYAVVLTTIALMLSLLLLSNKNRLVDNHMYYKINNQLLNQIKGNNKINFSNLLKFNSDGSGFIDNYKGSGSNIYCRLQTDGSHFIKGDSGSVLGTDGYDDNCNSDNLLGNNTGSIDYMSGFEDNDNMSRKEIIGLIYPGQNKNVFWNNEEIEKFIENNPNNNDNFNKKLGDISEGVLYLNISTGAIISSIEYDKNRFKEFNEIKEIKILTGSVFGSGYLESNGNTLSLSGTINSNTLSYNFSGSGYLLFLKNNTSNLIDYNITGFEKSTGSGIYLNPIDDDINNTGSIEVLGYDVLISKDGKYFGKMLKNIFVKK